MGFQLTRAQRFRFPIQTSQLHFWQIFQHLVQSARLHSLMFGISTTPCPLGTPTQSCPAMLIPAHVRPCSRFKNTTIQQNGNMMLGKLDNRWWRRRPQWWWWWCCCCWWWWCNKFWYAIVPSEKTNTVACKKKGCWCNIGPSKKTNNLACNEFRMLIRHRAVRKDKNAAATPGCYGIGLIYSPQTQPSIGCTSESKIIRRDSSSKMQPPPSCNPHFSIYLSIWSDLI